MKKKIKIKINNKKIMKIKKIIKIVKISKIHKFDLN